jgi:hypothetical protein
LHQIPTRHAGSVRVRHGTSLRYPTADHSTISVHNISKRTITYRNKLLRLHNKQVPLPLAGVWLPRLHNKQVPLPLAGVLLALAAQVLVLQRNRRSSRRNHPISLMLSSNRDEAGSICFSGSELKCPHGR